ncbi:hypothetical protein V6N11_043000 [Hibiscus sabdariffa]|uniref:Uncharacterized protein n=1 Tax=Hibiscus sabdariffa TaxID=183260 RepID=A0ABR2QYQ7_9ROSI
MNSHMLRLELTQTMSLIGKLKFELIEAHALDLEADKSTRRAQFSTNSKHKNEGRVKETKIASKSMGKAKCIDISQLEQRKIKKPSLHSIFIFRNFNEFSSTFKFSESLFVAEETSTAGIIRNYNYEYYD